MIDENMKLGKKTLVSFVVPCYNYGRYLPDCLNSIFGQEGNFDFEVILIDDGSTDNTQDVIHSFSDYRIRLIRHQTNLGHVATINKGLSEAQGTFIARIDPDDRYRPYFLSTVLPVFNKYPEVGLVYGDAALINERGEITAERSDRVHDSRDFKGNEFLRLLEENFICSPTVIARREAWQKSLPVPEGLAFHDWFFTLMMARECDFYYIDIVLADYRVHPMNHHKRIVKDRTLENSIFKILDHIFSESEKNMSFEREKQTRKDHIYAAHYIRLGDKYFGSQMDIDARRSYLRGLNYQPRAVFKSAVLRRLLATYIGRSRYEFLKKAIG